MRTLTTVGLLLLLSAPASAQQPARTPPPPTDRTKASHMTAAQLAAAIAELPTDRPIASVRVFSLEPYNVNVEHRMPLPQGASVHEAQAELFYIVEGSATLLTSGTLVGETRNGTNLRGTAIEGGTANRFGPGDFLIVPSGVAHQFIDIESPVVVMTMYLPDSQ